MRGVSDVRYQSSADYSNAHSTMKIVIVVVALVAAASAAPQYQTMEVRKSSMMAPAAAWEHHEQLQHHGFAEARSAKSLSKEGGAEILEHAFDMEEPGRYLYHFKTNNGIAMMEQAAHDKDAAKVQGAYEWTSPEGVNYKVEYVADEMGFHPMAAHLPVAPAVPEAILRSLEYNAAHPEEDKEAEMYQAKKIMY